MIKLLVVADGFVYPPCSGGDQAVFNSIRLLRKEVELHLFVVDKKKTSLKQFASDYPDVKLYFHNISHKDKYEWFYAVAHKVENAVLSIVRLEHESALRDGFLNMDTARYWRLYLSLNDYIRKHHINIVQMEFARSLPWMKGITANVKKVFVQHEIQFVVKRQRLNALYTITKEDRQRYHIEKQMEIHDMNYCDAIITLSQHDANLLKDEGIVKPIYPSFAKVSLRTSVQQQFTRVSKVVFIGPEHHLPNRNGVQWFLEKVWPIVIKSKPQLKFEIIGYWSDATRKLLQKVYPNMFFHGFVDNLASATCNALLIVPILEASGIRMKILEAVNMRIPFVSTIEGAVGLGFTDKENCFLTNEPEIFASDIIKLIDDPNLAKQFIKNAQKHLLQAFSDDRFVESRMKCFKDVLNFKS